ncbi:MAG: S8 family peptidase [Oscillospiraceae bacterium]|nr:S8 family peptidase [Oscillospiraceae bacterium]
MSLEDIFYDPDVVSLVMERESVTESYLENNPNILFRKELTGGYSVIYVRENNVDKVVSEIATHAIVPYPLVLGLMGTQELTDSGITQVQQQPFLNLMGSGVLLGFIDTGIDYTSSAFRYEDGGSKILYIWDHTIRGGPPDGYPFGTEYSTAQIDQALRSPDPHEIVPHRDTVGHGTFLASIAGGRGPGEYTGAAPDAEIIAVKLKRARPSDYARFLIPPEQENAFSSADFMLGVQYIIDKALALRRPVAICIAMGTNSGGHDGYLPFGSYLSRISTIIGVAVCSAAGNEGQAKHHTHGRLAGDGDTKNIELRVGSSHGDVHMSIWNFAADRMSVSIRSPTGATISRIPARSGIVYTDKLVLERTTVRIEYIYPIERSGSQVTRIQILSATPGIWTITLHGDSILDGTYHAWLPITGFIDPETVFLSPSPNYTIVTPGNTLGVISCGAYDSHTDSFAAFSSQGPSRFSSILPVLVAPGVEVSGIFPGGPGVMSGTSVSSAITTGACALMLQWGIVEKNDISLDSYRIRVNLIAGCTRDPTREYPNNQWGYGRLNLYNTFRSLRSY